MSDTSSWPEQDAILKWLKEQGIELDFSAVLPVIQKATSYRLAERREKESLKAELVKSIENEHLLSVDRGILQEQVESLKAENERLKKNSDLYLWLRDKSPQHKVNPPSAAMVEGKGIKVVFDYPTVKVPLSVYLYGEYLDAAVGAAIRESEG